MREAGPDRRRDDGHLGALAGVVQPVGLATAGSV
jgi:hypothetical protein